MTAGNGLSAVRRFTTFEISAEGCDRLVLTCDSHGAVLQQPGGAIPVTLELPRALLLALGNAFQEAIADMPPEGDEPPAPRKRTDVQTPLLALLAQKRWPADTTTAIFAAELGLQVYQISETLRRLRKGKLVVEHGGLLLRAEDVPAPMQEAS